MKKYDEWQLSVIKKYFKNGKIPKSTYDINQKLEKKDIDQDIRLLLDLAVAKISKGEDISTIIHSIISREQELNENVKNKESTYISEKLFDKKTLSKLELEALKQVVKEEKDLFNFDTDISTDLYNSYEKDENYHHRIK